MARIRSIKPTFWSDEKIGVLARDVRLTFLGLISAMADDHGRLVGNARIVRGAVYPFDDDVSIADVVQHLEVLESAGRICRYQVAGSDYIQITNWTRHQRVDRPSPSLLPPRVSESSSNDRDAFDESSANARGSFPTDRKGEEGKGVGGGDGKERSGRDSASGPETVAPVESAGEVGGPAGEDLAPLFAKLPPAAIAFLGQFYEPALTERARKRYREVGLQLVDALEPGRPGPKLRGGVRAKARGPEHLGECCAAVMADPPMDRDAAVVIVLKKLMDPPKGPSVSEQVKAAESSIRALEERYHAAAHAAGVAWARAHPTEYAPILAEVDATYRGRSGAFAAAARLSELAQRCAAAAAFPPYDIWLTDQRRSA